MSSLPPEPAGEVSRIRELLALLGEADEEVTRRVREFLTLLPSDPAAIDPAAIMAAFRQMKTADEAELAAQSVHPVSIVHGEAESASDEKLIYGPEGLHALAARVGQHHRTRAGNDYTTWFFDGPDAEQAAITFIAAAKVIAQDWWVITPTAHPEFRR